MKKMNMRKYHNGTSDTWQPVCYECGWHSFPTPDYKQARRWQKVHRCLAGLVA